MSKLSVLEAHSFSFHQYIASLTSSASDLQYDFLSIEKVLIQMLRVASTLSDDDVLDCVESICLYMQDVVSELEELQRRLSSLASLPSR
ncbi:hypothetical protein [Xylella fastidiosa]|uniref:hypothetical protein n=1 Tax=Xylella fastidiosa TaxID=2371 RepID=UPI000AB2F859|nr:hypothetical protein [Xylella fastidiosa]